MYPKISDQTLLSEVPEIHGRSAAGVSVTSSGHAPATAAIAAPPASSRRIRDHSDPRAAHSHAAAIPGTISNATPIFVSNPRPTHTPLSTSHRVRPVSIARNAAHSAATADRISSSSGLLCRATATVTGVVASTIPATNPETRPNRRATRSYRSATAATPISASGTRMLSG